LGKNDKYLKKFDYRKWAFDIVYLDRIQETLVDMIDFQFSKEHFGVLGRIRDGNLYTSINSHIAINSRGRECIVNVIELALHLVGAIIKSIGIH